MAIRSRFADKKVADLLPAPPPVEVGSKQWWKDRESEETPTVNEKAFDARGVFDFSKDAYEGSTFEAMGVARENVGGVARRIAYGQGLGYPNEQRVQDLLTLVRSPLNPGDSVEVKYRNRIRSPLTAIRAFCVECQGGSPKSVNKCTLVECPFWAFRMGQNGYRRRADDDNED
jgi:hypothetical protein